MAAPATVTLHDVLDAAREIVALGRVVNGGSAGSWSRVLTHA